MKELVDSFLRNQIEIVRIQKIVLTGIKFAKLKKEMVEASKIGNIEKVEKINIIIQKYLSEI